MSQQIQLRRGTAAAWTAAATVLASGEVGVETDTGKFKVGNGTSAWAALTYFVAGAVGATNLAYTAAAGNGIVTSDTGTDATLTAADGTNAGLMLPAGFTKLAGIETGATADQTAAEILAALLTVDGSGSGLDADLLDGNSSAAFVTAALYDANTILYATTDNTPIALSVPTSRIVGRKATGDITAMSGAETTQLLSGASDTQFGIVELATSAETITGTDTIRAVTPAGGAAAYQPLDSDLTAIAGLTSAADKGLQFTGVGTAATFDLTTFAKTILDDANAAAVRATLDVPSNAEAVLDTIIDAKGDILVGTAADTITRLAVGTNTQVLTADSAEASGVKWAAAAAGGGAVTLLASTVLAVDTASFSFTSISGAYNHLKLVILVRGNAAGVAAREIWMRFNNDSTAIYDYQEVGGQNATAFAGAGVAQTKIRIGYMPAATATAGIAAVGEYIIPCYKSTTFQKAGNGHYSKNENSAAANFIDAPVSFWWRSAVAITRIDLLPQSSDFLAGSEAYLYGIL